jgi:hypothetical protein
MLKIDKQPVIKNRVRKIDGSFSFIPHDFVTKGFLPALNQHELLLYFLLVTVGDRHGLSYYSQDKLCILLQMSLDELIIARNSLIDKSLIAFDGFMFQVLSLPEKCPPTSTKPLTNQHDFENDDPFTIRRLIQQSIEKNDH